METILLVLHLLIAIFLVAIILLQQASGGALDGLGGGGSSAGVLNSRGKSNLMTKTTAVLATLFIISSISLSIYYRNPAHKAKSILEVPVEKIVETSTNPVAPTTKE